MCQQPAATNTSPCGLLITCILLQQRIRVNSRLRDREIDMKVLCILNSAFLCIGNEAPRTDQVRSSLAFIPELPFTFIQNLILQFFLIAKITQLQII